MFKALRFAMKLVTLSVLAVPASGSFVNFESEHVHPIALSPDGMRLFAVNTPDNRVAVFDVTSEGLSLAFEVPVGLEPVSVAARSNTEIWVANHVSDTVSIIDLTTQNVVATLQVGDEPTDVVFAGGVEERAFVCVSQEDAVKIYDPEDLGAAPVVIPIFGSDPRALAVSNDSLTVYAAVSESGNQTTVASEQDVRDHGGLPEPNPPGRPDTGLILKFENGDWVDEDGTIYTDTHPYTLPDHDVAVLDAATIEPTPTYYDHLGTLNFNLGVHPVSGKVYVSNTDALNHIRFEPNLRGQFMRTRMSIVDPANASSPTIVDLNAHIDYSITPGPQSEIDMSLSQPGGMAFASAGGTIYLTALGSGKVAVLDDNANVVDRIEVGEGPSGLVLDEANERLYVLNRFANTIAIVATDTRAVIGTIDLYDPSLDAIKIGRKFLYDGRISSGHGDLSCASCHAGGNFDGIAWDLGDPNGTFQPPPPDQPDQQLSGFHPMKGPMVTQTLRDLNTTQPFHWRGDRADFVDFNGTFVSLMGLDAELPTQDMQAFTDFIFAVKYAPNPGQNLDRSFPDPAVGPSPEQGRLVFMFAPIVPFNKCVDCHHMPTGTNGQLVDALERLQSQDVKTPHLRNQYEKTGFTGTPGEKKRGFGFHHDGSTPTIFEFLQFPGFNFQNDDQRRDMEAFMLTFDTGTAPAVGAQLTVDATNQSEMATTDWLNVMIAQDELGDCDLVVKGRSAGLARGWVYEASGMFRPDRSTESLVSTSALLATAGSGSELTFMGVPEACGVRIGIDRDEDGFPDRTEIDLGSNPADAASIPDVTNVGPFADASGPLRISSYPNPARSGSGAIVAFELARRQHVRIRVFQASGRYVATILDGTAGPGAVQIRWDGRNALGAQVSSGKYFYRIVSGKQVQSRSVLLVR